jgi:hypothetical protein
MNDNQNLINRKNERWQLWREKLKELDTITDNEGVPIDDDIKETVAVLNLIGIPTAQSCAGHIMGRLRYPMILGWAKDRPVERFTNDKDIRCKIASKYHISVDDIEFNSQATEEYYTIVTKLRLKETKEYKKWIKQNKLLRKTLRLLLKEFYSNRNPLPYSKLYLAPSLGYLLVSRSHRSKTRNISYSSKDIPKIKAAQEEMKAFTEFLKNKFFNSTEYY